MVTYRTHHLYYEEHSETSDSERFSETFLSVSDTFYQSSSDEAVGRGRPRYEPVSHRTKISLRGYDEDYRLT